MRNVILPFLTAAAAACHAQAGAGTPPRPDAPAVLAEADRMGASDLWAGFDPRTVPVALFDGERTWLFHHPAPPEAYSAAPDHPGLLVRPGRDSLVRANSSVEMNGVRTATVMPFPAGASLAQRAAVVVHEAFHVFQRTRHPTWIANEGELFTYPVTDVALLAQRRLESEALRRALAARTSAEAACWAGMAMSARRARFAGMSEGAVRYERGSELNEGLASYVQERARGFDAPLLPEVEFPAEAVRQRFYATGPAMGRILDRLDPSWRVRLEAADSLQLDGLLAAASVGTGACAVSPEDRGRIEARAAADAAALAARLAGMRQAFLARAGWRIVLVATGEPLWPRGFDPLNVQVVAAGEVLHGRMVQLGNASGSLEVLGRPALSVAAGAHPLFNGVREVTITGLTAEPVVDTTTGAVRIETEGLRMAFRGAVLARGEGRLEVRLP